MGTNRRIGSATLLAMLAMWAGCGSDDNRANPARTQTQDGGARDAATAPPDAFYPTVSASDPCTEAGYFFDKKSDCNVVRCPELTCDCPASGNSANTSRTRSEETIEITISACVPTTGCLSLIDCKRLCDPAQELSKSACEERMVAASSAGCKEDEECIVGECRTESTGPLCVDALGCATDSHCSTGAACLHDPNTLDPDTDFPTRPGACADGSGGSVCYEDGDCSFGRCSSQRCSFGENGESCEFNRHCASGFCFKSADSQTGRCVSGDEGEQCINDGDCDEALHCVNGTCASNAVGEYCVDDTGCDSEICVSGRCRSGVPGSRCEEPGDCASGHCVGSYCSSGQLGAPCREPMDCKRDLSCARLRCSDGSAGSPCSSVEDCSVLACVRGTCSAGKNGTLCDSDVDCQSGRCANPAGVEPGVCTPGNSGDPCIYSTNCASGSCSAEQVCN